MRKTRNEEFQLQTLTTLIVFMFGVLCGAVLDILFNI